MLSLVTGPLSVATTAANTVISGTTDVVKGAVKDVASVGHTVASAGQEIVDTVKSEIAPQVPAQGGYRRMSGGSKHRSKRINYANLSATSDDLSICE